MHKKIVKTFLFCVIETSLITGCQSTESEQTATVQTGSGEKIEMKSEEEQRTMLNDYTVEDYQQILEEAKAEAENLKTEDELLNKWIFRTLAQEKLYMETDLTEDQVLQLAKQSMKGNKAWKSYAEEEYGIRVTDEEVDAYISEGPDTSEEPQHLAMAKTLGMTLKEYNHHYDRDIYEKNLMWEKLKPILEDKYDITDNNQLVKKYEEEVDQGTEG